MDVEQLKEQRKSKKNTFNKYAKRRDAIRKIVNGIDSKLDDEVSSINKQIDKCIDEFENSIKGSKRINSVYTNIRSSKESFSDKDLKLSSCRKVLSDEITRCQKKINDLDAEIRKTETQIKEQGGTIYFWE